MLKERQGGALTKPNKNHKINKPKKIDDVAFVAEEDEIEFEVRLLELEHKLLELSMEMQKSKSIPITLEETEDEPAEGEEDILELDDLDIDIDVDDIIRRLKSPNEMEKKTEKVEKVADKKDSKEVSNSPPDRDEINNKFDVKDLNLAAAMNVYTCQSVT